MPAGCIVSTTSSEVIIYDYADMRVPVLARMAAKRRVGYQAIGYKVLGARDLFSDRAVTPNEPHKSRADRGPVRRLRHGSAIPIPISNSTSWRSWA
jgi:hypothetical protein